MVDRKEIEARGFERLIFFSDVVFAIAIIRLYWFVHWGRFQLIERIDARLVGLNLILTKEAG